MRRLTPLAAPVLLLGACVATEPVSVTPAAVGSADLSLVQTYLREGLRDPDSARFRNAEGFRTLQGDRIVCGELNATNGFGGYVGYQPFYVRLRGDQVDAAHMGSSFAALGCQKARDGVINVPTRN